MKDRPQKRETEQLHTGSAPVELEEYSLEEIMREFGGWSDWSEKDTGLTPPAPPGKKKDGRPPRPEGAPQRPRRTDGQKGKMSLRKKAAFAKQRAKKK